MAEPTGSASAEVARPTGPEPSSAPFTVEHLRNAGLFLIGAAAVLTLVTVFAGFVFTAPPASELCAPPQGGQDIPCPPLPLTVNDLFALLTLVVVSVGLFVLGVLMVTVAWVQRHPAA